jgi:hypothetical protein
MSLGFKKLFGQEENKDLLIDFLNTFLPERHKVRDLKFGSSQQSYVSPYEIPDIHLKKVYLFTILGCEYGPSAEYIVCYCAVANGENIVVKLHSPVNMETSEQSRCQDHAIVSASFPHLNSDSENWIADTVEFIGLQLPLFTKTESELNTRQDKWLFFLKNLESFESIPPTLRGKVFEKAFAAAGQDSK